MAFDTISKRFQIILVILLACGFASAETYPHPPYIDEASRCNGSSNALILGGSSTGTYYIMSCIWVTHVNSKYYAHCADASYWNNSQGWVSFGKPMVFEWLGGYYSSLQSTTISAIEMQMIAKCGQPTDYDKYLNLPSGEIPSPKDDLDGLIDWINDFNNNLDEDNDGIPDQYDQDCPLHDQFKEELCAVNPDACSSWDDPQNYKLWQNDHYAWLVNNTDGALYDYDGDGYSDGWENVHGYDNMDPDSCPSGQKELDGIDWTSGNVDYGNIGNWQGNDSDGDGFTDGLEWDAGTDWNDSDSTPDTELYDPDWYDLDYDGDGQINQTDPDPIDSDIHSPGYSPGGYTGDGTEDTTADAPDEEEIYEDPDQYVVGDYPINPGNFNFGDEDYDNMLHRFDSIRGNWDALRPNEQRDYKVYFNIPFPGGVRQFDVSLLPDTTNRMGQSVDQFRQWIRILFIALMTYWFIRNIWLVLRQY